MSQAEEIEPGKTLHEQFLQKYHVYEERELKTMLIEFARTGRL